MAERIASALSEEGIAWKLLLVDDDSDDGSTAVVTELAGCLPVRMRGNAGASCLTSPEPYWRVSTAPGTIASS